jgi:hypothetical protein
MFSQQKNSSNGNDLAPIGEPTVMSEQEFLIAVSKLSHDERMEFLRCLNATH